MNEQHLKIGGNYDVTSQRKGNFKMTLNHFDETWASGTIIEGKASAICKYNEVYKGEEVTVRRVWTTFKEI